MEKAKTEKNFDFDGNSICCPIVYNLKNLKIEVLPNARTEEVYAVFKLIKNNAVPSKTKKIIIGDMVKDNNYAKQQNLAKKPPKIPDISFYDDVNSANPFACFEVTISSFEHESSALEDVYSKINMIEFARNVGKNVKYESMRKIQVSDQLVEMVTSDINSALGIEYDKRYKFGRIKDDEYDLVAIQTNELGSISSKQELCKALNEKEYGELILTENKVANIGAKEDIDLRRETNVCVNYGVDEFKSLIEKIREGKYEGEKRAVEKALEAKEKIDYIENTSLIILGDENSEVRNSDKFKSVYLISDSGFRKIECKNNVMQQ